MPVDNALLETMYPEPKRKPKNALLAALSDPEFYRYDLAQQAANSLTGLVAGVAGAPVDLAMIAARPFGYGVPAEQTVLSSDWIGRMMGADRESPAYIAGSIGVPDPRDAGALLAGLGAITRRAGKAADASPKLSALPLPEVPRAVRQARATEGGFYEVPVYHGTGNEFQAFDLSYGGQTSGSSAGRVGVSVALDPDVAAEFANRAGNAGGAPNVMPLRFRAEQVGRIELDGTETNSQIRDTLLDAWDAGFDAAEIANYTSPGGLSGRTILIVRDPSQLRSPHAAFDPAKRGSADLMAGGAAAALGLSVASQSRRKKDEDG